EKNKEKDVSSDDDEPEKIVTEGQTMIDVDALETDEHPQPKHVQKGIERRLRSRTEILFLAGQMSYTMSGTTV
ncbi:hypothetical protein A2U01_0083726, partial [Trifolium medium]|nr:hypothetical protein [Trifolium medium]